MPTSSRPPVPPPPPEALTFDDVLLLPGRSRVLPRDADISTKVANLQLQNPLLSAAMDTVTEANMAVAMAQAGGLGVIHKNLNPREQAEEVAKVKRFESGVVSDPVTIRKDATVGDAMEMQNSWGFSGLPVVDKRGKVAGIVTNRDLRFQTRGDLPLREIMTPRRKLVVVNPRFKMDEVKNLMRKHRIERVVIVDHQNILRGLVTVKDIIKSETFPNASKDDAGRLLVAAAVGAADFLERAGALADAGADALALDSAHGHSEAVLAAVAKMRKRHPKMSIIAGNIATAEGAKALAQAGANAVKVGVGPGSICTTRVVAGVGVPQISAIQAAASVLSKTGKNPVSVIADGGVRYSGDIAKAVAAGADAVMIGGALAGADESPGEIELFQGRAYKRYRGMGSLAAMRKGAGERYFQNDSAPAKLVPEGVEGRVPYKGKAADVLFQLSGGLRAAMGYVGAANLAEMRAKGRFVRATAAGTRESHVHDVQITREAPNYHVE